MTAYRVGTIIRVGLMAFVVGFIYTRYPWWLTLLVLGQWLTIEAMTLALTGTYAVLAKITSQAIRDVAKERDIVDARHRN